MYVLSLDLSNCEDFETLPPCLSEYNPVMASGKSDETPVPWDHAISVKDGVVTLTGHVDACGFGKCSVSLEKELFHKAYDVRIEVEASHLLECCDALAGMNISYTSAPL